MTAARLSSQRLVSCAVAAVLGAQLSFRSLSVTVTRGARGAVAMGIIIWHGVVRGGVCDDAHEEGGQGGIVDEGEEKRGVDREGGDGAHGGYGGRGGRLHAFLAELDGAGVADSRHRQGLVRNPGKVRTGKQRAEA